MKIIFLDIDGVLNSYAFLKNIPDDSFGIDNSRLPILKRIIDETGAKIVLSSSWRKNWSEKAEKCTPLGLSLIKLFSEYGIEIFGKTPEIDYFRRADEIKSVIESYSSELESFVILDDIKLGWGDLSSNVVVTDERVGRGLENEHADRAIAILNK